MGRGQNEKPTEGIARFSAERRAEMRREMLESYAPDTLIPEPRAASSGQAVELEAEDCAAGEPASS